ncbi:Uncharacterised protein [Vibrio cholerae]|nr:Uncharacterised protein [Vibrio cholerae]
MPTVRTTLKGSNVFINFSTCTIASMEELFLR